MGLSKPADAAAPFDHDAAIKALLPAYIDLLTQLKALGVPEVCGKFWLPGPACSSLWLLPASLFFSVTDDFTSHHSNQFLWVQ